ncbi:response regulator transcription factor [Stenotrophomonas maltophilia]|uniref:response regulator transcription factor n=1 Tax=Stenotrophomonas maltophilia TaxID=40324 RepID=UPI003D7D23B4
MANPPKRKTIMLLDDHPMVGHAIATTLQDAPHLQVIGDFNSSRDLLKALEEHSADVVIMDYALGPGEIDGLNLIRRVRARQPNCRIMMMSGHFNPATVMMAMQAGADGFIGKSQRLADLVGAVYEVLRGRKYLHPDMQRQLEEAAPGCGRVATAANDDGVGASDQQFLRARLTAKEHEVVRCIIEGMTTSEIALKFHRQVSTISTQKKSAFSKLGVVSVPQLVTLFNQTRR